MKFKFPKNTDKIFWTKHSKAKMQYYKLSENRIKRVLRNPTRKEEGIAPQTIAVMQRTGTKKHPTEIWAMYQTIKSKVKRQKLKKLKIISAWRYPGVTPEGKEIPIPEDTLEELENIL